MNCSDPAARSRGTFRGLAARLAAVFARLAPPSCKLVFSGFAARLWAVFSDPAARSRGTFRGLAARLAAVFSRPCGCPDARALQGPARALCGRPLRLVFGRARDDRGLDRAALAHRPGLGLCFALVVASSWAGQKRRAAVKGRGAAKRSDVYPLRRTLFCETGRAWGSALWDKRRQTG